MGRNNIKKAVSREKVRSVLPAFASLVAVTALLTALCTFYIVGLRSMLRKETDSYLNEISQHVCVIVQNKVDGNIKTLETIASSLESIRPATGSAMLPFLQKEAKRYGLLSITAISREGKGVCSDGIQADFSAEGFFRRTLEGETVISNVIQDSDGFKSLIYSVPLADGSGSITGVLAARQSLETLEESLAVTSFSGEGFFQIITSKGEPVIKSNHPGAAQDYENAFSYLETCPMEKGSSLRQMKHDMMLGNSGELRYTAMGVPRHVCYLPLQINDWYLLSIVPSRVTSQKTQMFVRGTTIICFCLCVLFAFLVCCMAALQKQSKKKLERMAFTDPITGALSPVKFEMEARGLIMGAPRRAYAMAYLNIGKFKLINDTYGREAGNKTLRYVCHVIQSILGPDERVCRVSADNFSILLRFTTETEILERLSKLGEKINSFNDRTSEKYWLTLSEGIFIIDEPDMDFISIQERANIARQSLGKKTQANNSYAFYSDVARDRMVREKEIENRMEAALQNEEFIVYLQPKVELQHDRIAGAEALVRWQDPERGLIPPDEFIPVFEKNGFIVHIDLFVFEQACRCLSRWKKQGYPLIPISVNLSRVHLQDPSFLDKYEAIFKKYRIPARMIEIELTETLVFDNIDQLVEIIGDIHRIGFTCSLDDFGSGYSSLNMLKDVPVDVLKLDRAFFLTKEEEGGRGYSIIESVVELAKKLSMETVSEGVETPSQVDFLRKVRCDMVQGYVFSKPLPIKEFEARAFSAGDLAVAL